MFFCISHTGCLLFFLNENRSNIGGSILSVELDQNRVKLMKTVYLFGTYV